MGYLGTIHGFKTVKAESCNKRPPVDFNEDLFQPWDDVSYEKMGDSYTLANGEVIYNNTGSGGHGGEHAKVFGDDYDGSKNTAHRHSRNSIFFKTDNGKLIRDHDNDKSDSFVNTRLMYPTSIAVYTDSHNNGNSYGGGFTCRGTKGYPFPVRGISFDYFVSNDMGVISGAATNHRLKSGAKEKFYTRQQINRIWGIWYQYSTNKYVCKKLTPNGDNWGGKSNVDIPGGKYIFRDSGDYTKGRGEELMEPEHSENQDKHVLNHKFRIRAMINKNESPPANSVFLGFHWQHSYGNSSAKKVKIFNVSNVQIIDPMSAALFYDDPSYHGRIQSDRRPKESPYSIIRPELYGTNNIISKDNAQIALHQISTVDTDS